MSYLFSWNFLPSNTKRESLISEKSLIRSWSRNVCSSSSCAWRISSFYYCWKLCLAEIFLRVREKGWNRFLICYQTCALFISIQILFFEVVFTNVNVLQVLFFPVNKFQLGILHVSFFQQAKHCSTLRSSWIFCQTPTAAAFVHHVGGVLKWLKVRPHGRIFVRRCPRTKVRVRLTFTSYSYFCTMLKIFFNFLSKRSYTAHY